MKTEDLISLELFCSSHNVEISFIRSLHEYGLIEVSIIENVSFISIEHIHHLEKMMRMHYEMDINIEGIEAIIHLLKKLDDLHNELSLLKNRINLQ
jgi:hypothetical protein